MQASKLTGDIRIYLPLFVILVVVVLGILITRDLYESSTGSPPGRITQLLDAQIVSGADRPCLSFTIYTSLPAKCKTADGRFIELGGTRPDLMVVPAGK